MNVFTLLFCMERDGLTCTATTFRAFTTAALLAELAKRILAPWVGTFQTAVPLMLQISTACVLFLRPFGKLFNALKLRTQITPQFYIAFAAHLAQKS